MPQCCAYNCSNRPEDGYAVFMVPQGKRDRLKTKQWLHYIGRKNFVPTRSSVVCEAHFSDDQFEPLILQKYGKKKLKPNAVPKLFSHRPAVKPRKPPRLRIDPRENRTSVNSAGLPDSCNVSRAESGSSSNEKLSDGGSSELSEARHEPDLTNVSCTSALLPATFHASIPATNPNEVFSPSARTSLPAACSVAAIGPVPSSRDRFSPSKECLELPNARHEPDLTNALGTPAAVSADFSESAVKFTATSESCSPSEVHQEVPYTPHDP
ncbi:uncharacterized protein LOC144129616 [Amblyomma americanum]